MAARGRLSHIDGLRGVAALLVVVDHWFETVSFKAVPAGVAGLLHFLTLDAFSPGRTGVVAFFCISGFVIPFSFKGEKPLRHFVVSRFFRLYPAYWFALLLAILVFNLPPQYLSAPAITANISMLTKFLHQPYLLGVAWTLTVELMFYAICFVSYGLGLLHSPRFHLLGVAGFFALAAAMGAYRWTHAGSELPAGIATFLGAMHFGALVRLWRLEGDPTAAPLLRVALVLMVVLVPLANTWGYYGGYGEAGEVQMACLAISTGYFAGVALFLGCIWRHWFASPAMIFLGAISYSVYLLHSVMLELVEKLWPQFGLHWVAATLLLGALYAAATLALSTLVYRWLERPAIRFGHRLMNRDLGR